MARFSAMLLLALVLGGCSALRDFFEAAPAPTVVVSKCPALKQYPQEQLTRAADELAKLPAGSAIVPLVRDYKSLRDACRTL